MDRFPVEVFLQFTFGVIAVCGGVARYLNSYANGAPFKLGIFVASAFVAGFSGWVFSLIGQSMLLPNTILYAMAGAGGFFGEQSMKFVMDYFAAKLPTKQL